jgi:hypothetical protein
VTSDGEIWAFLETADRAMMRREMSLDVIARMFLAAGTTGSV